MNIIEKIIFIALILLSFNGTAQDKTATEVIDQAYEMFDENDYNGAVGLLNRTIKKMPDSTRLYLVRGVFMDALKRFEEAVADYTIALEMTTDPKKRSSIYSNRGASKNNYLDDKGAYEDLQMAIKEDSTNINAFNNLSIVCGRLNKTDESIGYLKKIVQIDPDYLPGYINLGFIYQKISKHKEALEYFDIAVKMDPEAPLAYSNRSFSRLELGDIKGAYKDIEKSIKLYPNNCYAYKLRALIYIKDNKLDEACADLELAERMEYTRQYGNEVVELREKHCKQ